MKIVKYYEPLDHYLFYCCSKHELSLWPFLKMNYDAKYDAFAPTQLYFMSDEATILL